MTLFLHELVAQEGGGVVLVALIGVGSLVAGALLHLAFDEGPSGPFG